jgi:hypothetical protein
MLTKSITNVFFMVFVLMIVVEQARLLFLISSKMTHVKTPYDNDLSGYYAG